jgi:phosphoglycerol transferase
MQAIKRENISFRSPSGFVLVFVLGMFGVASFLFLRAIYIHYPVVMADEELYALHAKFLHNPRFPIQMPNILFFFVYHLASWFGENHLTVAKLLNATFFALSMIPLYMVAREFLSRTAAYLFSILVVISPISSYSVYVMPEAMFFFAFWVLTYVAVVALPSNLILGAWCLGLTLAALTATKPHGLVLIGLFPVLIAVRYFIDPDRISWDKVLKSGFGFCIAFAAGRFSIEYLAHGDLAVSLFGSFYRKVVWRAPRSTQTTRTHSPALSVMWPCLRGHLAYLAVLFGPGLLFVAWPHSKGKDGQPQPARYTQLLSFSVAVLAILLAMVVKFSADNASADPTQLCRLHGRYYDFLLPTFVLLFLSRSRRENFPSCRSTVFKLAVIIGAVAASAFLYHSNSSYCVNFVDFPEIEWIASSEARICCAIAGCLLTAIALAFLDQTAARVVYCSVLVVLALMGTRQVFRDQIAQVAGPPSEDLAGIAVRNLVGDQIDDGMVFARSEDERSHRAMFQLYSLSMRRNLHASKISQKDIPSGVKWILTLDPYELDIPYYSRVRGRDFDLILLSSGALTAREGGELESYPRFYELTRDSVRPVALYGFYPPEEHSTWTNKPVARVYFDLPIAGRLELAIKGRAYGPNVGKLISIKLGDVERQIKFSGDIGEVKIDGDLAKPADYLEFSGIVQESPAEFEHASDPRPLGLAIFDITITRSGDSKDQSAREKQP